MVVKIVRYKSNEKYFILVYLVLILTFLISKMGLESVLCDYNFDVICFY